MENSAIRIMYAIFYALGVLIINKNQRFADLKIFIFTPLANILQLMSLNP
jgi:hypothetical protein